MIRSGTLPTLPAIAAFVLGGLAISAIALGAMRASGTSSAQVLEPAALGARVLVIVPHPDDEILATGGTIRRLLESGAHVKVIIVTAGDSYRRAAERMPGVSGPAAYLALGEVRHRESLAAAADIGLPATDLLSLGYADGATAAMWDASWNATATAPGKTEATTVPYAWAVAPGAPLNGSGLATRLESIITDFAPDTIITPDVHETHPDHATVAAFAMYAMDAVGFRGLHLSDVVHFRHYPYPWAHLPALALDPPPQLIESATTWHAVPLRPEDQTAKTRGIAAYASQTAIADLGLYMRAFIRTNELFATRVPARPAVVQSDGRPAADAAGTVDVTPRPVIAPAPGLAAPRIDSIRMLRGPRTLWVGLTCDRAPRTGETYRFGMRLFGGSTPARLDVSVKDGVASAAGDFTDSVVPSEVRTETDGATVWIALPSDVLAGRARCMVGARASSGGRLMRTAWREVDL
jgi:LmbE family N-acetylglucosaminyl deacetylase